MGDLVGQVFNIQRYSTHDGPGIRTTVFLKGCPLRCFWCQNPESQSKQPVLMYKKHSCTLCGRCIKACSQGVIRSVDDELINDRARCTACGACVSACLAQARSIEGKNMTVSQVMTEVKKDFLIYLNSGGGMTLSGGDCEMQPEFAAALLATAQKQGIHTAVEITGAFPWETVKQVVNYADVVLYDLKCMDETRHQEGTGISNTRILENAKTLVREKKEIYFRMPLIPGFNDSREAVKAVARFVRDDLGLSPADYLELLAYNNLGENKYTCIDYAGVHPQYRRQSEEYIEELNALCASI